MTAIRILLATLMMAGLAVGWYFGPVPNWLAIGSAVALVSWGLDLDWRRKERVAGQQALTEQRKRLSAARQAASKARRWS